MSTIILFHSALGLDQGMHRMADVLKDAGHTVHLPDFYDGNVFTETADGLAYRDDVTFPELAKRASVAVDEIVADSSAERFIFGGFSLGAAMAQSFGKRHPQAAGALLFHAGGTPTCSPTPPKTNTTKNSPSSCGNESSHSSTQFTDRTRPQVWDCTPPLSHFDVEH